MSSSKSTTTEEQWGEVHAGAPVKWTAGEVGDSLIGIYVGFEEISIDDPVLGVQLVRYYDVRDDAGYLWTVPNSFQIEKGFARVAVGARIKLTYLGEIDLGKKGHNPMKNYSLHVAK